MTTKTTGNTPGSRKPASMSSLLATKGAAAPAGDVHPRGEDTTAPEATPPAASPAATNPTPEVPSSPASLPAPLPGSAGSMENLVAMIGGLQKTEDTQVAQPVKVTVNVKLHPDTENKLKRLVGFEKMRRMSNFSQQDYLESRLTAIIDFEFAKLPKFD